MVSPTADRTVGVVDDLLQGLRLSKAIIFEFVRRRSALFVGEHVTFDGLLGAMKENLVPGDEGLDAAAGHGTRECP